MRQLRTLLIGMAAAACAFSFLVAPGHTAGTAVSAPGSTYQMVGSDSQLTIVPDRGSSTDTLSAIDSTTPGLQTRGAYSWNFTPSASSFSQTDPDGRWEGSVSWGGTWPMSWRYTLNMASYAMAWADSNATEDADQYVNGVRNGAYHDHHVVPVSYGFHSIVPVNNGGVPYEIHFKAVWHFTSTNASGTATLNATFRYRVTGNITCGVSAASGTTGKTVRPNC